MTDNLDPDLAKLDALVRDAMPAPDPARRAENIALAQKNFAALQESAQPARPTVIRPIQGLWTGARNMMNTLTSRAGLTACTALIAVGLVAFSPLGDGLRTPAPVALETPLAAETTLANVDMAEPALSVAQDRMAGTPRPLRTPPAPQARMKMSDQGTALVALPEPAIRAPQPDSESFANAPANPVLVTAETPVSTFSIDVDTASYAVVRNSLMNGQLPPRDAVRIEEMVNYFSYGLPAPTDTHPFKATVEVSDTPWNTGTRLMRIGVQGVMPDVEDRPPLNLVFLIDTSGSMDAANKLPLLKQSFRLMLGQLRDSDEVAIVTYAGSAGQVLAPTPAAERATILAALDRLGAGGSTAGQAGLQQAYATAAAMAEEGDINRVILATDGDFNVGLNDPEALKDFIADRRDSGTYLSVLGFGRGNLDDATLQALAQNGNGQAAYIDTLAEAQKVLVDQLTGALFPIANDVKIQVEFNPARIAEYRLIGYETRALRREDFNNDRVDAGDIGAGHSVTALYEITPVGSPALRNDALRYGEGEAVRDTGSGELAFVRLRYKAPGQTTSALIETPVRDTQNEASFATAIAGFGQLLRGGDNLGDWTYADAIALATATKGADPYGYRTEAIRLMRLAQSLSEVK